MTLKQNIKFLIYLNNKKVTLNQVWRKFNTLTVNNILFMVLIINARLMKEI